MMLLPALFQSLISNIGHNYTNVLDFKRYGESKVISGLHIHAKETQKLIYIKLIYLFMHKSIMTTNLLSTSTSSLCYQNIKFEFMDEENIIKNIVKHTSFNASRYRQ